MKQLFNNINNKKKAFTLIELLIVIAIIGILSGAVIVAMSGTQESAIDSRIKASIAQLRSSIEIYGLVNGANYTGLESDSEISLLIDDIESQVGTPTVNISGSGDRYCLSTNLKSSNELWCIDSAGFAGLGGCINYSCDTSLGYSSGGIPISTGLVGYWTMDEDSLLSSNTIRDYSPYGNTGTIYGATFATDRHGQSNKAMSFDGVDDYVSIGAIPNMDFSESFSIGAWANLSQFGDSRSGCGNKRANIVRVGTNPSGVVELGTITPNRFWASIKTTSGWLEFSTSGIINNWTYVVFVNDESANKINLFINGKRTNQSSYNEVMENKGIVNIGGTTPNCSYGHINGLIDDVRIYNRALSAEEIAFLYNSSR